MINIYHIYFNFKCLFKECGNSMYNLKETWLTFFEIVRLFTYMFAKYHLCSYGHLSRYINKLLDFGGALAEKRKKTI